tara:strand:+ start:2171 stop:2596 length:426 start_codon:yes stop_codon:yes gene_type:complete
MIPIKKLKENAKIPTRAHSGDAGYDLYSTEGLVLLPGERHLFKTGIALAIPKGYYGRIAPRSGLAFRQGIDVLAGVIDPSYREEIGVLLINLSESRVEIKSGDRIAQMIFESCAEPMLFEVDEFMDAEETERVGGFGSSGE